MTLRELLADYGLTLDRIGDEQVGVGSTSGIHVSAHLTGGYGDVGELEVTIHVMGIMKSQRGKGGSGDA